MEITFEVATNYNPSVSIPLKIWIISPHHAVVGDLWGQRHARSAAQFLVAAGHSVTYWAQTFSHAEKRQRRTGWGELMDGEIRTILVPVREYSRNVSLMRLLSLRDFARNVEKRIQQEPAPDVILGMTATPFLDSALVRIADQLRVPLVCDFQDLWPELFESAAPNALKPLVRLFSAPFYKHRRDALRRSAAVAGTCKAHLNIAIEEAPHLKTSPSIVLYLSGVNAAEMQQLMSDSSVDDRLPEKQAGEVWITYAGSIGNNYDVETLVSAAKLLAKDARASQVRIMVAGDGPQLPLITKAIEDGTAPALKYLGTMDLPRLARLYAFSDIALAIYAADSTVIMPAKAYDLFAAGLPILNSLQGEFMKLIEENNLGIGYRAGDPESLANAMLRLATDSAARAEMRKNLLAIAPQYDRDLQYAKVVNMVEAVAAESRAQHGKAFAESQSR